MKGKDIVTLTTEQMEQNVQYKRRKYQESKIEPIMAVDEVLHCDLVNIQCVGNKTINIGNLICLELLIQDTCFCVLDCYCSISLLLLL